MGAKICGNYRPTIDPIISNPSPLPKSKKESMGNPSELEIYNQDLVVEHYGRKKNSPLTDDYKILDPPLGKGGFGEVRKAIHKYSGLERAVKIINKTDMDIDERERLVNEVQILKTLDHPNIIKIFEFFEDEKSMYIVTELCTGGELFDRVVEKTKLDEIEAAQIMQQVFSAVFYCHNNKIVHRDLKPENILYDSPKEDSPIKIIDFGTSRVFDPHEKMNQKYGTPYYIAPEVLKKTYDEKCDIWSCGVLLYVLLCGFPPFNGPTDKIILEKVSKGSFILNGPEWDAVSNDAKRFLRKLMEYDPVHRLSAEQALNDNWLKGCSGKDKIEVKNSVAIQVLKNLKSFRANSKIHTALWGFIVAFCSTSTEKEKLLKIFKAFDLNGDGQLTKEELLIGYKKIMKVANPEEEVERIMEQVDQNNSGVIDYSEFVIASINRKQLLSKERLEKVFRMFDIDGNGFISRKELKNIFAENNLNEETWDKIITAIDPNKDGQISLKEFVEMMNSYWKEK